MFCEAPSGLKKQTNLVVQLFKKALGEKKSSDI